MDELLNKQAPHSAQAEQAIIGSMLIDARCIPDVVQQIKASDFYMTQNKDIFETIYSMFSFGKPTDPVTILDEMKVRGIYKDNLDQYMAEVMRITPTAANVLEYCTIVKNKALMRGLADAADKINEMVYDGSGEADDMLEASERYIYNLRKGRDIGGLQPIGAIMGTVLDNLDELSAGDNKIPGLTTGLVDLDRNILGMNPGELIILAARPGMGKTSMALNIGLNAAKASNKTVAIFSLEMSKEQIATRLLSGEALVSSQKLMTGQLSREEWDRIIAASRIVAKTDIKIDDNPMLTVSEMNAQCRRLNNLGLVIIDYLQLMQSSGSGRSYSNESRTQVVSDISRMLKIMAKDLNVPVICLSQLSRANESRTEKRPMLSDLRESGSIEQDADVVIGIYRDEYYNKESETPNVAEAIILKNRKGQTGTVNLNWLPEYTAFVNLEMHRDDEY